jgi:hypothetical protein
MAAAAARWYGPLIDLAAVGGFVQLLVTVRRDLPHQVTRYHLSSSALLGDSKWRVENDDESDGWLVQCALI